MPARELLQGGGQRLRQAELGFQGALAPGPLALGGQGRGGGETGQADAPEGLGLAEVLGREPGDVVPVGPRARQGDRLAAPLRLVQDEDLLQQQRHRPAVQEEVVEAPHHLVDLVLQPDQGQAEQRRLAGAEAAAPVLLEQGLQLPLPPGGRERAPVEHRERQLDARQDHLQRPLQPVPEEGGAQHRVPLQQGAPGRRESRLVQAPGERAGELLEIDARRGGLQRVEEQPLLQGGERIQVLDLAAERGGEAVESRLVEGREREVRRGVQRRRGEALGEQAAQRGGAAVGERLHRGAPVEVLAVGPGDQETAAGHAAADLQGVTAPPARPALRAHRLVGEGERPVGQRPVDLPQVVEAHLRGGQRRQATGDGRIAQIACDPIAEALARHGAQALLDGAHRDPRIACGTEVQQDREEGGEPPDRAREVEVVRQLLAAVPLQVDEDAPGAGPAREGLRDRRQQHFLDADPAVARHVLQQSPGLVRAELHHDRARRLHPVLAAGQVHRQGLRSLPESGQPPSALRRGLRGERVPLEALRPAPVGGRLGGQLDPLAAGEPGIGPPQVVEQDAPRDAVHRQVMDDDQQASRPLRAAAEPDHPQQRPALRVQARLSPLRRGLDRGRQVRPGDPGEIDHREGGLAGRRVELEPAAVLALEAEPERVVMLDHRPHGRGQAGFVERLLRLQEQRLVEVVPALGPALEEPALDGGERSLARHLPLLRLRRRRGARDRGQLRDGLVLEQVLRRQAHAHLGGPRDDLDRQDRIAAQGEEVVVDADPVDPQDLGPDPAQRLLGRRAGLLVALLQLGPLGSRRRQGTPVDLAVGRQRQGGEGDEGRWHHVLRQLPAQVGAHLVQARRPAGRAHHVGDEPAVPRHVLPHQDQRLGHPGTASEDRLDLAQLDAEPPDLDLVVDAAEILQLSRGAPAAEVAAPVQPRSGAAAERVRDEPLGGQLRPAEIAQGDPVPTDVELPRDPHRRGLGGAIQHVDLEVRNRNADHAGGAGLRRGRIQGVEGDVHRRLGDAVHVDQRRAGGAPPLPPGDQAAGIERLAAEDHPAQPQRDGLRARRVGLYQMAEGRRRLVEHRHPLPGQQVEESVGRAAHPPGHHHQAPAPEQGSPQLPDREVEGIGVEERPDVGRAEAEPIVGGREQPRHIGVGDGDALGPAGRPRGVDDIGRGLGRQADPGALPAALQGLPGLQIQGGQAAAVEALGSPRSEDQGGGRRVREQIAQPLLGIGRVERHVGAAGLQDPEDGREHLQAAIKAETDARPRLHPQGGQPARQAVGPPVELAVAQRLAVADGGHRLRSARRLLLEELVERPGGAEAPARTGPLSDHLLALALAQQRQLRHAAVRVRHRALEQTAEVAQHPLDGRGVEEVRPVFGRRAGVTADRLQGQGELEFRRPGRGLLRGDHHVPQDEGLRGRVLQDQHDLEQRRAGQLALRLQLVDHLLERDVLVGVGAEGHLARAAEQGGEAGGLLPAQPQHQGVGEEPDQPLDLGAGAVGDRRTDGHVLLMGVAPEERAPGGQQGHEQGGPARAGQGGERLGQRAGEDQRAGRAVERLHGRPRPVGREIQDGHALQVAAPVGEQALQDLAPQPVALPLGEVGVLHRQLGKGRGEALGEGVVRRRDLADQHAHRPAVAGDVVHHEGGGVLLPVQAQDGGAQQRGAAEVERQAAQLRGDPARLGLPALRRQAGEVDQGQRQGRPGVQAHHGVPPLGAEVGAQDRVSADDLRQAAGERRQVQRPGEPDGGGDVVGRGAGLHLVEEPEPLLGEGERQGCPRGQRAQRRRLRQRAAAGGLRHLHQPREAGHGRLLEQAAHGQLDLEDIAHPRDHLRGEEGVPAEREEIVEDADAAGPQHLLPDAGHQLLDGRAGRLSHRRLRRRRHQRQSPAVDLAVRGQRQRLQADDGGRDHVGRQPLGQEAAQIPAQRLRRGLRCVLGHHVGHQAPLAVLAGEHHRLAHGGMPAQRPLDLAQLDAEAPDLDLLVGAPGEDHLAVRQVAPEVAGAVQPVVLPAGERVDHEALGGQGGVAQVAQGDVGAAHTDLPDLPHAGQRARGVEHQELDVRDAAAERQDLPGRAGGGLLREVRDVPADGALRLGRAVVVDAGDARRQPPQPQDVAPREHVAHEEGPAQR